MPVLPKLMVHSTFHIEFIVPASRAAWHVDAFAHCGNSSVAYDASNAELTSESEGNVQESVGADLSWAIWSRHFSLSEFWPFPPWAGGSLFPENRKGLLGNDEYSLVDHS